VTVTVSPESFALVFFDAAEIEAIATTLLEQLGMSGTALRIEVDESSPIARAALTSTDPLTLSVEGGAFENPKEIRHLSPANTADVIGRFLLRWRDRQGPMAAAPLDDDIALPMRAAWDAYCNGRLDRLGYHQYEPRWRYHFRNRHGFTDVADEVFDELWAADGLTWDEMEALSQRALAARPAA
jgi:hypothetical protein